jgi:hypothetical protein
MEGVRGERRYSSYSLLTSALEGCEHHAPASQSITFTLNYTQNQVFLGIPSPPAANPTLYTTNGCYDPVGRQRYCTDWGRKLDTYCCVTKLVPGC